MVGRGRGRAARLTAERSAHRFQVARVVRGNGASTLRCPQDAALAGVGRNSHRRVLIVATLSGADDAATTKLGAMERGVFLGRLLYLARLVSGDSRASRGQLVVRRGV